MKSTRTLYYTGSSGGFGITTNTLYDSLTLTLDGYETQSIKIKADDYQSIIMKVLLSNANQNKKKLISITKDRQQTSTFKWGISDESYFSIIENETVNAKKYPNTGFSVNVNKASYSNIRRFINMKSIVPPDAVRVEELLNYFNLHYKEPEGKDVFRVESQVSDCPWNNGKKLFYLNIDAKKLDLNKVPPSNLVFLIDASGSMDMPNRLPLVKAAFQMLVKNLRPVDTVSIVTYGGYVGVWLQPTSGAEKQKIIASIEELTAKGDTPGESGIRLAYKTAEQSFIAHGNNRVILATDGDFNVGEVSEKALEDLISKEKQTGVYLTCLGVGMGNFKDSKLEALAKRGNGNYAYLDDINEAEKVLVKEMTQTFFSVADDVFLNVQFNPDIVKDYRLIGFDNKKDVITDSTGVLEGGDIGSGNSVMAVFEVTPSDENSFKTVQNQIAEVSLKYSLPKTAIKKELKFNCINNYAAFKSIDKDYQFATALVMFGMKLRQSKYIGNIEWPDIELIATAAHNPNEYLQKEFLQLLSSAKKLYGNSKKKKKGYE